MSTEMAATLWAAVDQRWSFVVTAIPRFAGKSTVLTSLLSLLPSHVRVHHLNGEETEITRLKEGAGGGYLVVSEISQAPVQSYIWGTAVPQVFDTLPTGYSLATTLHAPNLETTFDIICHENGVTNEQASLIRLVLHIQRFGNNPDTYWRRLAQVHEIDRVEKGRPVGRLLHHWVEERDSFEVMERSIWLETDAINLERRTSHLRALVASGHTGAVDVAQMVAEYHAEG